MSGFVYFIAPEALLHRSFPDSIVKIGYTSSHPKKRLRALQTGSPVPLVLWAYTNGTEQLEKAFHDAFSELRAHGEWFYAEYKLHDFLCYLGDEPNIGNFIDREKIGVALFDNVLSDFVPHPSVPEDEWKGSADFSPLAAFYPELMEWA